MKTYIDYVYEIVKNDTEDMCSAIERRGYGRN